MNASYISTIPLPCCEVATDSTISNANRMMKNVFVYEDIEGTNFFALTGIKRDALLNANEEEIFLDRNGRTFRLWINEDASEYENIVVIFEETTMRENYKKQYDDNRPVVMLINIDNYDALTSNNSDDGRRVIPSQIDGILRKWTNSYKSPITSIGEDRYIVYTNNANLTKMLEDNFSVLEEVRNIEAQIDFPASLSIGIGVSTESIYSSNELAESALELALGRGGDQAVVKDDEHTRYYGGTLQSFEKNNRSKARVIAHAMKALITAADNVLIMSHKWPDMDAFGSSIGAYCICKYLGKEASIVMDKHNEAIETMYRQVEDTDQYNIIKSERAMELMTDGTLLIIVDVNRPGLLESMDVYKKAKDLIVIDHHRMTGDSIQDATIAYVESYASSASELIAELIQHFSQKRFTSKLEAEAMLAGIMVDSNNFSGRTGVRTFEAAAWLKRAGADTTEVKRFFQMEKSEFMTKANTIAGAVFDDDGMAYAETGGDSLNNQIINAQVADELLMVKGVRASFVIGHNEQNRTIISARSLGDVNVQSIMERLGGGGHFTSAAAQTDDTIEETWDLLKKYIKEYLEKESQNNQ